jgi:Flp pilus assembly pilin Flp
MFKRRQSSIKGQGVVEYILITAFVALATISIFKAFRENLRQAYQKAGDILVSGVEESLNNNPPPQ